MVDDNIRKEKEIIENLEKRLYSMEKRVENLEIQMAKANRTLDRISPNEGFIKRWN